MAIKTSYEKLSPADQLAVDSMVGKAKKEELEEAYKEVKSKEALKKKPLSCGEVIAILIIVSMFLLMIIIPTIELSVNRDALRSAGYELCKNDGSTYKYADFSSFTKVRIICEDKEIILPSSLTLRSTP